jgi:predicted permease
VGRDADASRFPRRADALNAFSFRFALPALLLRLIAGQPLRQSFNPEFYIGYLASGAIIFVLVPLILAFFRERGAGPPWTKFVRRPTS